MRLWRTTYILIALFTEARWSSPDTLPVHDFEGYQRGDYGNPPQQTFKSSNITAPILNYGTWRKDLITTASDGSSHIFLTLGYEQAGPYLFSDDDLSLVYADPSFEYTMNARVQIIDSAPYLSFWHGARNRGDSQGFCVFYDQHYNLAFNVTLGAPFVGDADMHECEVTPDGNVLLTAYLDKAADLTALGGMEQDLMADGCFQEIVPATGEVAFSWCASDWFEPARGYWHVTGPIERRNGYCRAETSYGFDVYHINSLQKTKEGNYLVSLRNLKLIAYIDGKTGEPTWELGGKNTDFVDDTSPSILAANPGVNGALDFGWQHHVRFLDDEMTLITMFDNQKLTNSMSCTGSDCSRGRLLQLNIADTFNPTVQLLHTYLSPHNLTSVIFGSMQMLSVPSNLDTGSVLIGWGVSTELTEHTIDGELIRDVQYSILDPKHSFGGTGSVSSYRVFKHSWHGYPPWPPEVALDEGGNLYVSWNGATEVRFWAVFGSQQAEGLGSTDGSWNGEFRIDGTDPLMKLSRAGFETKIGGGGRTAAFLKVVALEKNGQVLGTTRTLETGWTGLENEDSGLPACLQNSMSFTCLIRLLV